VPSTVQQKELMEKHGVLLGRIRKINESITDTEQKKVLRGYAQDLIYEKMSPDEIKDLLTQFEQQQREGRT
jgi:hypothetical protein